ncbi:hypothetical protein D3C87_1118320 [compost metagenome]
MRNFLLTLGLASGLCVLMLGACSKHEEESHTEIRTLKVEDVPADIRIPSKAYSELQFAAADGDHAAAGGGEHEGAAAAGAPATSGIVFAEVSVILKEKNPGVVKGGEVKIKFPRGGGEVNLADYITETPGSFYVSFEYPDFAGSAQQKVIFVSKARKRRIDNQVFGAGCNQYFDITKAFAKAMLTDGIKVNTVRERYTSVLGGHFLFSAAKEGSQYMAQVTFRDSTHNHLFCEDF